MSDMESAVAALDWKRIDAELDAHGCATTGPLLSAEDCAGLRTAYDEGALRRTVVMARHGYGSGEYKYFAYPLPPLVEALRHALYPRLVVTARRWAAALGTPAPWPDTLAAYLAWCRDAGQPRPTPLLLRYGPGDYNCLHQDLYGEHVFPLQVALLLDPPGTAFTGGEFVLTEQRPRRQSRAEVVSLAQGEGVIFAVRDRPERGPRGYRRVTLRHGVSRLRWGTRHTLGLIFHDAA